MTRSAGTLTRVVAAELDCAEVLPVITECLCLAKAGQRVDSHLLYEDLSIKRVKKALDLLKRSEAVLLEC